MASLYHCEGTQTLITPKTEKLLNYYVLNA